ncbi:MAG: hypothetical protein HY907_06170 [Deltaproteobacteria bacterium]|nr:hypothetical protein [Deltaproteobacteria bacterium]
MRAIPWISALAFLAAAACNGGDSSQPDADAADVDDATDAEPDAEAEAEADAEPEIADEGDAEAETSPPDPCTTLGLPVREFIDAPDDPALYAVAADVSFETWDGTWTLSAAWSGCDVYLFIQDTPQQESGWTRGIWERDVNTLLARSPRNVHYFFVSTHGAPVVRNESLTALQGRVDTALGAMSEDDRAWWTGRIHYLPGRASGLPGWLGAQMISPGWGVAIDRFQRLRFIGSYADFARYDAGRGWFAPNLSMAANEAVYYNFEAERDAALQAEDATVVHLLAGEVVSDPGWAGARTTIDVDLPDAAAMAGFDTLELDLYLGCVGDGEYGDCPAWDYINSLYLCDESDPDICDVELGRWITTYHREGRWVHDASALLPLLGDGGSRRFAFYSQQPYETTLDLRFSDAGKPVRPEQAVYLFSGGALTADYDTAHPAITLPVPADAAKVEIATVLSGHGMADLGNCAEFCNVNHHYLVNGTDNVRSFPQAGTDDDCMQQTGQGTVPNQYGTWWYGRSGWCPGREVPIVSLDVTDQVVLGADNTFEYRADYGGAPYTGSGANIDLTSWLVISR